jgi:hypothetical protein
MQIYRNFLPVGDFSTFKRPNYCSLSAEHSARCITRRNEPNCSQNGISHLSWTKNDRNLLPVGDISTFKRRNHYILHAEHSARWGKRRNEPNNSHNTIIRPFWRKLVIIAIPLEIFRRLNAQSTIRYAQKTVHAVLHVETSPTTRKTRSFVDFDETW